MRRKNDVIVELFADDPCWEDRILEVLAYLDVT